MKNSFSFRPIEFIVMAVLISFSLTITIAVSGNSRKYEEQAECMAKLCKWGAVIHTINDANNGELPLLRPEMSLYPNLLRCPTTHDDYTSLSGPVITYHLPDMIDTASYGFNYWYVSAPSVYPLPDVGGIRYIKDVQNPENVPLMLDSMAMGGWPRDIDQPPLYNGEQSFTSQNDMKKFAMDRHSGGVHVLFVDDSVRRIKVMGLWLLKWHRTFNTSGPWTPAGGMLPSDLPEWLREDN
ncbi:MAG: hypothetical protein JW837_00045 [Sedimentisphaerales bacterium]|nr:hypothetical protein [Sedimentisphaerales bacterium]